VTTRPTGSNPADRVAVHLVKRPEGVPALDCFAIVSSPVPEPAAGQLLVRSRMVSVDPSMRGRMNGTGSYVAGYGLNSVVAGRALGEVVAAGPGAGGFRVGDTVVHWGGWQDWAVVDAADTLPVPAIPGLADELWLGALGAPGLTAYIGVRAIGRVQPGDSVYVSAAAGAVGSMAGQLARAYGAGRVLGSAGSSGKVSHLLRDLGFGGAFDYKQFRVTQALDELAPDGIDVYFDNVGGDHLAGVLPQMNNGGRIVACGAISQYNGEAQRESPDLTAIITKRLRFEGFIVGDHADRREEFIEEVAPMLLDGRVRAEVTVFDGIERAPEAFLAMFRGETNGKTLVRC
jgi:NADPH-dependent curcumin reductase CurA